MMIGIGSKTLKGRETPRGILFLFAFLFFAVLFVAACRGSSLPDGGKDAVHDTPGNTPQLTVFPTESELPATVEPSIEPSVEPSPEPTPIPGEFEAVFLGVKGYGRINAAEVQRPGAKIYRFRVDGEEKLYSIRGDAGFSIQNRLMEGYTYGVTEENSEIVSVRLVSEIAPYSPVVSGIPGERTLRNFLTTAFMPLGTTLYVYGGGWDWQDKGSSVQATSIGVSGTWTEFFRKQNANYLYKDSSHPESSYYPFGKWNEYYYAGLDCSGYVGWVMYNTLETVSGQSGYVVKSDRMAKTLAVKYGFGSWSSASFANELRPGDIVSMPGHVWICVGKCADGSIVIIHSSPCESVTGCKGGGVQLSALNPNGDSKNCEAYRLASRYQQKYYPEWSGRYPVVMKSYKKFVEFTRNGDTGIFRFDLNGAFTDPDGFRDMSAAEVLKNIFGE